VTKQLELPQASARVPTGARWRVPSLDERWRGSGWLPKTLEHVCRDIVHLLTVTGQRRAEVAPT
jgi:hypothetical protein